MEHLMFLEYKVKLCPVENFSTKSREPCMDGYKSNGSKETKSSG